MDCFFRLFFHAQRPRTVRLAHTVQLFLCLKTSWMPFFCRDLVYSFGHQKTFFFYDQPEAALFFLCLKKTCYVWRRLVMPEEAWRSFPYQKTSSSTSTPRVPLSCALGHQFDCHIHCSLDRQTLIKLWLSEHVSVRFNQNLLKQCTHKYYIRLSG